MKVNVKDVIYLFDLDEKPLKSLEVISFKKETILNDINVFEFEIDIDSDIISEQHVIFRDERFIVDSIEESRSNENKTVSCISALTELGQDIIDVIDIQTEEFPVAIESISKLRGWTIGHVDDDEGRQYSMYEESKSPLEAILTLCNISSFYLVPDTINRVLHFYKKSGVDLDEILRYGKNTSEIKRIISKPKATELKPLGRGGLTIDSVNNGSDYIEDYSWYESLGVPLNVAKQRYRKRHIWKDERYIYAGNLLRAGQEKLSELSKPQITYVVEGARISKGAKVGDFGYVVDEDLGIKVQVRIVRMVETDDENENVIELDYFIEGLNFDSVDSTTSDSSSAGKTEVIATYNDSDVNVSDNFINVIDLAFTSYAPTNMNLGVTILGEASSDLLLEGYFDIGGNRVGRELKQVVKSGFNTITMNFLILQVQEGAEILSMFLKSTGGTFSVDRGNIELFIMAENLLGGMSATLPKANVVEEVELINAIHVNESVNVKIQIPIDSSIVEHVELPEKLDVIDQSSVVFDGIDYTNEPPAVPTGVTYTIGVNGIKLEWDENTEDFVAGYNVYVDGIKQNYEVIFDTQYTLTGLESGETYLIELRAQSVWGVESEPYAIEVEMP